MSRLKKTILFGVAIFVFLAAFTLTSLKLAAISCSATSSCGSCEIIDCTTGGCSGGDGGYFCECDGTVKQGFCLNPID
jgi:hypothetical protein